VPPLPGIQRVRTHARRTFMKDGPTSANIPTGALSTASLNEFFTATSVAGSHNPWRSGGGWLGHPTASTARARSPHAARACTPNSVRRPGVLQRRKSKKCWRVYQADDGVETGTALADDRAQRQTSILTCGYRQPSSPRTKHSFFVSAMHSMYSMYYYEVASFGRQHKPGCELKGGGCRG